MDDSANLSDMASVPCASNIDPYKQVYFNQQTNHSQPIYENLHNQVMSSQGMGSQSMGSQSMSFQGMGSQSMGVAGSMNPRSMGRPMGGSRPFGSQDSFQGLLNFVKS